MLVWLRRGCFARAGSCPSPWRRPSIPLLRRDTGSLSVGNGALEQPIELSFDALQSLIQPFNDGYELGQDVAELWSFWLRGDRFMNRKQALAVLFQQIHQEHQRSLHSVDFRIQCFHFTSI